MYDAHTMAAKSPEMNIMMRAAETAGRSLTRDFGEVEALQISKKGPGDFVSAADHRAESIIHNILSEVYPDDAFLMEESGEKEGKNNRRWVVDPLDGTANFLHGIPQWSISIALEEDGELKYGLVFDPIRGEMFTAEKGKGAFLYRRRLRVATAPKQFGNVVIVGAPRTAEGKDKEKLFLKEYGVLINAGASPRRFGSAALDLCYVAAARAEGFWERHLKPWDIAAGILIVKEAGGLVSDCDDDRASAFETGNILAANSHMSSALKKLLRGL